MVVVVEYERVRERESVNRKVGVKSKSRELAVLYFSHSSFGELGFVLLLLVKSREMKDTERFYSSSSIILFGYLTFEFLNLTKLQLRI